MVQSLHEEFGDQRAKDLIDRTYEVRDPLVRIALLHRALRYGRTGIQARKAYQSLGRAYEDLGKLRRAAMYYTKALDAGDLNTITRFWRGQAYYRLSAWEEAWQDLVVVTQDPEFVRIESHHAKLARRYLAEIAWMRG